MSAWQNAQSPNDSRSSVAAKLPIPAAPSATILETFANPARRPYWIRFRIGGLHLALSDHRPGGFRADHDRLPAGTRCLETKSLKFYLASYRNERAFNEAVTNHILDDLVRACAPRKMIVDSRIRLPRRDQPNDYRELIRTNRTAAHDEARRRAPERRARFRHRARDLPGGGFRNLRAFLSLRPAARTRACGREARSRNR